MELQLRSGEQALVAYGSLLSVASMEKTLGRVYDGPWHLCRLRGWRRGWDVQMPKHPWKYRRGGEVITAAHVLYLNLREQADSHVNAAIFAVRDHELSQFDEREWIYRRQRVNSDLDGLRVIGGDAWTYVALDKFLWRRDSKPPEAIIRQSYLDILDGAHAELGADFKREYDETTDTAPSDLIVDDFR